MKLCVIYNYAAHYRAPIFCEIDKEYDCEWFFGKDYDDIKKMDYHLLHGPVTELDSIRIGPFMWYRGVLKLIRRKDCSKYLVLSDTKDLSVWALGIVSKVFYPQKRVFFWSHGWYGKENGFETFIKKMLYRLPSGGVFVYGNRARDLMIEKGLDPDKLFVVYNSLNYDEQLIIRDKLGKTDIYFNHFSNRLRNIVFIGRLTFVKRFDLLLEAVHILKTRGEMFNVTFIGDGVERNNMKRKVSELGIEEQVWFFGASYDEKKNAELIFNADVCVSPGNIGLTAMHVLMFGCPAITNNDFDHQMPEFESIKSGITGDFFVAGDAQSLAETISAWFKTHNNDREEVRQKCFAEIDAFWNPHNQIKILKEVMGKNL